ncbi:hypothetical protein D3C87_1401090 [compost metagenome]
MKAYMAIVGTGSEVWTSVLKTNTAMEMLKHIFISGTTGIFDLNDETGKPRVREVEDFFNVHHLADLTVNEAIDQLISLLGVCDDDETEELVIEGIGSGLTDDPLTFLVTLRKWFNGEIEDLSEMSEVQTFLLVMMQPE